MSNTNPNYGHSKILSNLIHAMNHSSAMTTSSSGSIGGGADASQASASIVVQSPLLQGYLYKIHKKSGKTQKYFVIFDDVPEKPGTGRIEYFDTEKKFRTAMIKNKSSGSITSEKRSIILCTCFNINRRFDTKYRNVIGLYRKDDTFSIMAKDEAECNKWLKQLLILQRGKESVDAEQPRPTFGESFFFSKTFNHKCLISLSMAKTIYFLSHIHIKSEDVHRVQMTPIFMFQQLSIIEF